jgi:hypothetical protein
MYLNEEGLLKDGVKCDLKVIKMNGWKREMCFEETGDIPGFRKRVQRYLLY